MNNEITRLQFIAARDGEDAARAFAERTLTIYKACLKKGHARYPLFRRSFIESILVFRRFLRAPK